jgi:hypothetical protein
MTFPDRRCRFAEGFEFMVDKQTVRWDGVAPFVGAWIETLRRMVSKRISLVALFLGAWIETSSTATHGRKSLRSRSS